MSEIKRGLGFLTAKDLRFELNKICKALEELAGDDPAVQALRLVAKLQILELKMIKNLRDNDMLIFSKLGIEKATKKEDESE